VLIRIPAPPQGLAGNLLGLLGLALIVVAVGMLAGAGWAVLAAGGQLLGLSVISATHSAQQQATSAEDAPRRPAVVKAAG
jgi:hypothetical protein